MERRPQHLPFDKLRMSGTGLEIVGGFAVRAEPVEAGAASTRNISFRKTIATPSGVL